MTTSSQTHVVLIPSYNTGRKLLETVTAALEIWNPVWVVIDGSTDNSAAALATLAETNTALHVISLARNAGKGAAVLHGLRQAEAGGFTHVLTMDADGQHSANHIAVMMARSQSHPDAAILGSPVFDESAPIERRIGRMLANGLANLTTLGGGIGDALFGFRVYPIRPLLRAFAATRWMRRFDFDPEAAIRLCWSGVRPINVPSPVRYFRAEEGGVSHFNYLRDNLLLGFMYARLLAGTLRRLPMIRRPARPDAKALRPYRH